METQLGLIEESFSARYSNWVYEALDEVPENFLITDPSITGHPIVFASRGCLEMFGYSKEEVVGRNGRMFQGHQTCRRTVMEIREAIREQRTVEVSLLNYRKDGTPFSMLFHMCPVFCESNGEAINFVAVQIPILKQPLLSRSGRGRNGFCLCEDEVKGDILIRSCRREVGSNSMVELSHNSALDSVLGADKGIDVEELCEATEVEKQKATTALNNVLSVLTQYSASRGKSVSGRRCSAEQLGLLNSALLTSLGRIKQSFVLIDPHLPSMPVVYASEAFLKLTGYARREALGRRHRFLSDPDVDSSAMLQIHDCIQNGKACKARFLDYRKDRTSFWNQIHISPIRHASGKIAYFIEVHTEEDSVRPDVENLNTELRQLGAIAAVKVAVRSATMGPGCST